MSIYGCLLRAPSHLLPDPCLPRPGHCARALRFEALEDRSLLSVTTAPLAGAAAGRSSNISDLPATAQYALSAAMGNDQPAYYASPETGGAALANSPNGLTAQLQGNQLDIAAGGDDWQTTLLAVGRGNALQPVGSAQAQLSDNRVDESYAAVDAWYVNGPLGLQQGFTIASPSELGAAAAGELTVELALGGNLSASVNSAGSGLSLVRSDGTTALTYSGLVAYDAAGNVLPASLNVRQDGEHQVLLIQVDDAGAHGAITIDPFVQSAKLTASDGAAGDQFGSSVAVSGDTVVVGAPLATVDGNLDEGAAYVFDVPGGDWSNMTQTAKLTLSDGTAGALFGSSVAISGCTVVVGAPGASIGAAFVFCEPDEGWCDTTQTAVLTASNSPASADFGASVAIDGCTVVVGAPGEQIGANSGQGAGYVYVSPATGWADMTQTAMLTASSGAAGDAFGSSVAISADTVVVGAPDARRQFRNGQRKRRRRHGLGRRHAS
jgi:trimeric autotransporter adhesin